MEADEEELEMMDEREKLEREERYRVARRGDCLMCPFQCDTCHFINIQKRLPQAVEEDERLLKAIRRASLDAFWAREKGTVEKNAAQWEVARRAGEKLGIQNPLGNYPVGPFPLRDEWGMTEATLFLTRTLDPGRNDDTIQFDTARKLRAFFSNMFTTTNQGVGAMSTRSDGRAGHTFTSAPTDSIWFKKFFEGCHRRQGDKVVVDRALGIKELKALLTVWEEEYDDAQASNDGNACYLISRIAFGTLLGFVGGLRGEEIVKADLGKTLEMRDEMLGVDACYFTIALKARVKGETQERHHLLPISKTTASGLEVDVWFERFMGESSKLGRASGPMFWTKKGNEVRREKVSGLDAHFRNSLEKIQSRWPNILGTKASPEEYSFRRSLRRGSTTQARLMKVRKEVIDLNNRWRSAESSGARAASMGMQEHYSDVVQLWPLLIEYSQGM